MKILQNLKKKYLVTIPIVFLILAVGIFKYKSNQKKQEIEYFTVKKQSMQLTIQADGKIEAKKRADLTFKVPGRITSVPVEVGDYVKKWQWLAGINTSDFNTMHELSLEDYSIQRRNFDEKMLEEYDNILLTDTIKRNMGNEQSKLDKSVSYVELAYRDIKDASLYAPFDGVITAVNIEVGNLSSVTKSAITVQTIDELELTASIAETDIGYVKVGQEATYQLDAFANQTFSGKVVSIDPSELVLGGVVYYKITIDSKNLPNNSKIGMSTDIHIIAQQKDNVLSMPYYLTSGREGNSVKVKVLDNDQVVEKEITIGIIDDNADVEILNGLSEGDLVVMD